MKLRPDLQTAADELLLKWLLHFGYNSVTDMQLLETMEPLEYHLLYEYTALTSDTAPAKLVIGDAGRERLRLLAIRDD